MKAVEYEQNSHNIKDIIRTEVIRPRYVAFPLAESVKKKKK